MRRKAVTHHKAASKLSHPEAFLAETLEPRRLFAGVLLEATGRLGPINTFMQTMADDVSAQLGGPAQVPRYVLTVDVVDNAGGLGCSIQHVDGTGTPQTSNSGEIIVLLDYYNISANAGYSGDAIGKVVADFMRTTPVDGVLLTSLPIHAVAFSRGTAIMDGIALALDQSGIWIDQQTNLDPDPIMVQGDTPPTLYDNVAFSDTYWRQGTDVNIGQGQPVDGSFNLQTSWLNTDDAGWGSAHEAVSGYYVGTIDQTATDSGLGPIYDSWYGNTPDMPARNATGWLYCDLIGGARPLEGVWAASGGTGARAAVTHSGPQWGNITDLSVTTGSTATAGLSLGVRYLRQNPSDADNITFYLDTDRNPYNGNFAATLGSVTGPAAPAVVAETQNLSLAGVAPGTYWLCARITDAQGDVRYAYNAITSPLTVQAAASISGSVTRSVNGQSAGVAGRIIYGDLAGTGAYQAGDPSTTTDANGNYTLTPLPVGVPLSIREGLPIDEQQTDVPAGPITLTAGQTQSDVNFSTVRLFGSVSGTAFNDPTGGGIVSGEAGLSGRVVFADLLNTGQWNAADPTATTDATGNYTLSGLPIGTPIAIREVLPAGWRETVSPASLTLLNPTPTTRLNFAATQSVKISGVVAVQSIAAETPVGSFQLVLTEQPKHGKARKLIINTEPDGGFTLDGLLPDAHDILRLLTRKGYKPSPHASTTYTLTPASGQSLQFTFSQMAISAHKTTSAKKPG